MDKKIYFVYFNFFYSHCRYLTKYLKEIECHNSTPNVCVRGGPDQPLHRGPQWSIVIPSPNFNSDFDLTCPSSEITSAVEKT
jgi:hypothetical protein